MAKERITIDTKPAIRSLKALEKQVDSYSGKVKEANTQQQAINKQTGLLIGKLEKQNDVLRSINTAIAVTGRRFDAMNTATQAANANMRVFGRGLATANTNLKDTAAISTTISRTLRTASGHAGAFAGHLQTMRNNTVNLNRSFHAMPANLAGFVSGLQSATAHMHKLQNVAAAASIQLESFKTNTKGLSNILTNLRSVLIFAVAYRIFFNLTRGITDSVKAAKQLSQAIAEIRTISQDAGIATEKWQRSLIGLSRSYGLDTLDVAEGAYQALSNQVVKLNNDTKTAIQIQQFLESQIRLSTVAVATFDDAIQTSTAVVNAFNMSLRSSDHVSDVLFKTVELGRVRLEELSNTIGRVSVLSSQLGVTFEEQQAAITTLTRQGLKASEAITLLRNLELKLIKPTERMNDIFAEWGVTSGQSAIATFGYVEVLRKFIGIAQESGDEAEEIGNILGRLRAIVGLAGLANAFEGFETDLRKLVTAGESTEEAFTEVMTSMSKRVDIQVQRMKTSLIERFGKPIVETFVNVSEAVGGADRALNEFIKTGTAVFAFWATYRTSIGIATLQTRLFAAAAARAKIEVSLLSSTEIIAHLRALSIELFSLRNVASVAFAALAAGFTKATITALTFKAEIKAAAAESADALGVRLARGISILNRELDAVFKNMTDKQRIGVQSLNEFVAESRKDLTKLSKQYEITFKEISKIIEETVENSVKQNKTFLDQLIDQIDEAKEKIKEGLDDIKALKEEREDAAVIRQALAAGSSNLTEDEKQRLEIIQQQRKELKEILRINEELRRRPKTQKEREFRQANQQFRLPGKVLKQLEEQDKLLEQAEINLSFSFKEQKAIVELQKQQNKLIQEELALRERGEFDKAEDLQKRQENLIKEFMQGAKDEFSEFGAIVQFTADLEQQRIDLVNKRVEANEKGIAVQKKESQNLQQQLTQAEQATQRYEAALQRLSELDAPFADRGQFEDLVNLIQQSAKEAGISNEDRLKVLQQANEKYTTLLRQQLIQQKEEENKRLSERIRELDEHQKEVLRKEQDAFHERASFLSEFIKESREAATSVSKFFDKAKPITGPLSVPIEGPPPLVGPVADTQRGPRIQSTLPQTLQDVRKELLEIHNLQSTLGESLAKTKTFDPEQMEELKRRIITVKEALKTLPKNFVVPSTNPLENLFFGGWTPENFHEQEQALDDVLTKFNQLDETLGELNTKKVESITEELQKLREEQRRLNMEFDRTLNSIPGAAIPRSQYGLAFGGPVGTDRINASLSPGEYVMNAAASRAYRPLLDVINNAPKGNSQTINFGDIHLNVPQGTSETQLDAIVAGLSRRARQGRFNI